MQKKGEGVYCILLKNKQKNPTLSIDWRFTGQPGYSNTNILNTLPNHVVPTDITSQSGTATCVDPELNYLYSFRHKKHSTLLFLQPGAPH